MTDFKGFKKAPFLSNKTIKDHLGLLDGYDKNNEELLKKIKRLKSDQSNPNFSEFRSHMESCRHNYNAKALHVMYFNQISDQRTQVPDSFKRVIADINKKAYNWRNFDDWKDDFIGVAKASRGWAIMGYSVIEDIFCNIAVDNHDHGIPPGFLPILVLDVWEHAYIGDFGTNRSKYINEWFKYINWKDVEANIAQWLPLVSGAMSVNKLTASLKQRMLLLGIAKE